MIKRTLSWLRKPFPFYETLKQKIVTPLVFGFFIMFFLGAFNPFPHSDLLFVHFINVFAYGFITFFVIAICNILMPFFFPHIFNPEKWNILKTILYTLFVIISIGLANGFFAFHFDNDTHNTNLYSVITVVLKKTLAIGFLPSIIFIFYMEKRFYKKHHLNAMKTLEELNILKPNFPNEHQIISISSPSTKDQLKFTLENLYCIRAEGNYCMFFLRNEHSVEQKMIRCSLKAIEKKFTNLESVFRCHKSFIVNLDKVTEIKGNAKGYFFYIEALPFDIPGSRSLSKSLIKSIRKP